MGTVSPEALQTYAAHVDDGFRRLDAAIDNAHSESCSRDVAGCLDDEFRDSWGKNFRAWLLDYETISRLEDQVYSDDVHWTRVRGWEAALTTWRTAYYVRMGKPPPPYAAYAQGDEPGFDVPPLGKIFDPVEIMGEVATDAGRVVKKGLAAAGTNSSTVLLVAALGLGVLVAREVRR